MKIISIPINQILCIVEFRFILIKFYQRITVITVINITRKKIYTINRKMKKIYYV